MENYDKNTYTPIAEIFTRYGMDDPDMIPWARMSVDPGMLLALKDVANEGNPTEFYEFLAQSHERKLIRASELHKKIKKASSDQTVKAELSDDEIEIMRKNLSDSLILKIMNTVFPPENNELDNMPDPEIR